MNIIFYDSPGKRNVTQIVAAAVEKGLRKHGDLMILYHRDFLSKRTNISGGDAVIIFGISNEARDVVSTCQRLGKPYLVVDKGYIRRKSRGDIEHNAYWRASVNALHTEFPSSAAAMPSERWDRLKINLGEIRAAGGDGYILLISPALRVFTFLGLGDIGAMDMFFHETAQAIVSSTGRQVKFRGKLDGKMALTKEGWQFAPEGFSSALGSTIEQDISGASMVVTHTTNAGVRAVMSGVPVIELGCGVVRPLAETCLDKISNPRKYTEEERWRFMCWLAWQQWTLAELASGEAWEHLRQLSEQEYKQTRHPGGPKKA